MGSLASTSDAFNSALTDSNTPFHDSFPSITKYKNESHSILRETDDIQRWLNTIDLGEYLCNFVDNRLDNMCFIQSMDRNLLKQIGITKIGHQLTIMNAITKLNENNTNIYSYDIDTCTSPFYEQITSGDRKRCCTMDTSMYSSMNTSITTSISSNSTHSNMSNNSNIDTKYWLCDECNVQNGIDSIQCHVCGYALDAVDGLLLKYLRVSNINLKIQCRVRDVVKWECMECGNINGVNDLCLKCGDRYGSTHTQTEGAMKHTKIGVNV